MEDAPITKSEQRDHKDQVRSPLSPPPSTITPLGDNREMLGGHHQRGSRLRKESTVCHDTETTKSQSPRFRSKPRSSTAAASTAPSVDRSKNRTLGLERNSNDDPPRFVSGNTPESESPTNSGSEARVYERSVVDIASSPRGLIAPRGLAVDGSSYLPSYTPFQQDKNLFIKNKVSKPLEERSDDVESPMKSKEFDNVQQFGSIYSLAQAACQLANLMEPPHSAHQQLSPMGPSGLRPEVIPTYGSKIHHCNQHHHMNTTAYHQNVSCLCGGQVTHEVSDGISWIPYPYPILMHQTRPDINAHILPHSTTQLSPHIHPNCYAPIHLPFQPHYCQPLLSQFPGHPYIPKDQISFDMENVYRKRALEDSRARNDIEKHQHNLLNKSHIPPGEEQTPAGRLANKDNVCNLPAEIKVDNATDLGHIHAQSISWLHRPSPRAPTDAGFYWDRDRHLRQRMISEGDLRLGSAPMWYPETSAMSCDLRQCETKHQELTSCERSHLSDKGTQSTNQSESPLCLEQPVASQVTTSPKTIQVLYRPASEGKQEKVREIRVEQSRGCDPSNESQQESKRKDKPQTHPGGMHELNLMYPKSHSPLQSPTLHGKDGNVPCGDMNPIVCDTLSKNLEVSDSTKKRQADESTYTETTLSVNPKDVLEHQIKDSRSGIYTPESDLQKKKNERQRPKHNNPRSMSATPNSRAQLSEHQRSTILKLHGDGKSLRVIARQVGCTLSSVQYTVQKFERYHTIENLPKSGRARLLASVPDEQFFEVVQSCTGQTLTEKLQLISRGLEPAISHPASTKTIYNEWKRRIAKYPPSSHYPKPPTLTSSILCVGVNGADVSPDHPLSRGFIQPNQAGTKSKALNMQNGERNEGHMADVSISKANIAKASMILDSALENGGVDSCNGLKIKTVSLDNQRQEENSLDTFVESPSPVPSTQHTEESGDGFQLGESSKLQNLKATLQTKSSKCQESSKSKPELYHPKESKAVALDRPQPMEPSASMSFSFLCGGRDTMMDQGEDDKTQTERENTYVSPNVHRVEQKADGPTKLADSRVAAYSKIVIPIASKSGLSKPEKSGFQVESEDDDESESTGDCSESDSGLENQIRCERLRSLSMKSKKERTYNATIDASDRPNSHQDRECQRSSSRSMPVPSQKQKRGR
eukprot:TRINITY_DN3246_c1_g1_i4.p1 TRINITY_DN3246_c1_g1~~TRINITY_DN3246_c1_g1_i4.p1  ORF type:complete len:1155 (+),score=168.56 TRINITY_DN3246_c1_g1_i4:187-3651(+)